MAAPVRGKKEAKAILEEQTSTADFVEREEDEFGDDEASEFEEGTLKDHESSGSGASGINTSATTSQYELRPLDASVQKVLTGSTNPNAPELASDADITQDKMELLENAKKSAKLTATPDAEHKQEVDESSESQDCLTCFTAKKHKTWKETFESKNVSKFIHWAVKWLVFIIGLGNFVQALHDTYDVLQYQMKFDYFFALGIYNCKEWVFEAYKGLLFVYTFHGSTSVILLFGNTKATAGFALYWIGTQILLSATNILEGFFKFRFANIGEMKGFITRTSLLILLDVFEIAIVLLRFYLLDRPYLLRLKRLAASARLDRTLNGELFLRASNFLKRKAGIRDAAGFQTLAVIKKLKEEFNTTGMRAPAEIVRKEVKDALEALKDKSKYPGLKRLKDAEKQRKLRSESTAGKPKKLLAKLKEADRKSAAGTLLGTAKKAPGR